MKLSMTYDNLNPSFCLLSTKEDSKVLEIKHSHVDPTVIIDTIEKSEEEESDKMTYLALIKLREHLKFDIAKFDDDIGVEKRRVEEVNEKNDWEFCQVESECTIDRELLKMVSTALERMQIFSTESASSMSDAVLPE
jgi:hypothetical protein